MFHFGLTLLLSVTAIAALSQQYFPYLTQDGSYGISDGDGRIIDSRRYDLVDFIFSDPDYLMTRKGNAYGVCSAITGQEILAPLLGSNPQIGPILIKDDDRQIVDTLNCPYSGKDVVFFDPENVNKKPVVFQTGIYKTQTLTLPAGPEIVYKHNLWRFKKKDGLVNFYHRDGYVLLPEDVINGEVLTAGMLVVEGESGRLALMDTSGQLKTQYLYKEIEAVGDRYFIVNSKKHSTLSSETPYHDRAGVLTSEGVISVDTVYSHIRPVDDETLIVKQGVLFGLVHVDGRIILPLQYEKITVGAEGHIIVFDKNHARICNTRGAVLYTCAAGQCNFTAGTYIVKDTLGNDAVLNPDLGIIYSGRAYRVQTGLSPKSYLIETRQDEIIEVTDGRVRPFEKDIRVSVFSIENQPAYYLLFRKGMYGLMDGDMETVIPLRYSEIKYYGDVGKFLAKSEPSGWYFIYDRSGVASGDSIISPDFRNPALAFTTQRTGDDRKILLRNGQVWDFPGFKIVSEVPTLAGNRLYKCNQIDGDFSYLLNDRLYNIIPEGYYLKERFYKKQHVELGLIPVFDEFQCGVINSTGGWEIKPSDHSYVPMSCSVIIRYYGLPEKESAAGMDVLLRTPSGWISKHFQSVRYSDRSDHIRVALRDPASGRYVYGAIDTLGNTVVPVIYQEAAVLKEMIIAGTLNEDKSWTSVVYDLKGNVLCTLPYRVSSGSDHLVITNADNLSGAADLSGSILIDPIYQGFKYYPEAKLISYTSVENRVSTTFLAEINGDVLVSGKSIYTDQIGDATDFRFIAWSSDFTHVCSRDRTISVSCPVRFVKKHNKIPDLIQCETAEKKPVWIHLKSGRCFMD